MWIEVERRADGGPEGDDPDRGRREDGTPPAGHRPDADQPRGDRPEADQPPGDRSDADEGSAGQGEDAPAAGAGQDEDAPAAGAGRGEDAPTAGAAPGGPGKRPLGGDLRAAGWAVAAIVVATLSIFLVQRLYAGDTPQRGAARPHPTPGHTGPSPSERPGCTASFAVGSSWQAGFQATVTVKATGAAVIDGWTVSWTFPGDQTVLQMWNGHYSQTRSKVTVQSEGWNGSPSPKGAAAFGFVGSGAAPAGVQDLACTVSVVTPSPSRR